MKIIVSNEQEKEELLKASRKLHDARYINHTSSGINVFSHIYSNPDMIVVGDSEMPTLEQFIELGLDRDGEYNLWYRKNNNILNSWVEDCDLTEVIEKFYNKLINFVKKKS